MYHNIFCNMGCVASTYDTCIRTVYHLHECYTCIRNTNSTNLIRKVKRTLLKPWKKKWCLMQQHKWMFGIGLVFVWRRVDWIFIHWITWMKEAIGWQSKWDSNNENSYFGGVRNTLIHIMQNLWWRMPADGTFIHRTFIHGVPCPARVASSWKETTNRKMLPPNRC